ncbi:MAG: 3-hexulose-6-phosphate synthase, partial [Neobacillus sp.]|nr:3-hexulose-6-phosphate synthase [Neobacillus sp.]
VMGVSPLVTIDACMEVAERYNKIVMIDLLNTTEQQKRELMKYRKAVFCEHVSKDQQEELGASNHDAMDKNIYGHDMTIAAAGGITLDSLQLLRKTLNPSIVIIGSAITKAENPAEAAAKFKKVEAK